MTLTILTLVVGADYRKNLATCLRSKVEYAARHGYTYIQGDEKFWNREKPISWSKLGFLASVLQTLPDGALVWCSDADVYITNQDIDFMSHVASLLPADKDMLMTHDACGHVNAGNILYRNTPWVREFLKRVDAQTQFTYHIWWENAAICYLMETDQTVAAKIQVTREHKRFNAFIMGLPGEPLWEPKDFLVHFAGIYDSEQMRLLIDRIDRGEVPRLDMYNPRQVLA